MKDSIASRISRIITGTANTIVSRIEGLAPEIVLEQAIEEVDGAIDEVRAELGQITAQKHHVAKTMSRLNEEHSRLEEQVEVAFNRGRKDLVESALGRQTDIEDQLPALESQLSRLGEQEKEHNQAVTGLVAKRNEMEDELLEYQASAREAAGSSASPSGEEGGVSSGGALAKAERAENSFTRVLQRTTGIRRSSLKSSRKDSAALVELANLSRNAKIEAKMKELESRLSSQGDA